MPADRRERPIRFPGWWVIVAALLGVALVAVLGGVYTHSCADLTTTHATVDRPLCALVRGSPPWLLISGLAAAPAVLLTWYWRTVQRERDLVHRSDELSHRETEIKHREAELTSAAQSAALTRLTEATERCESEKLLVRNLGLHVIREVAQREPSLLWPAIETLGAFIHRRAPVPVQPELDGIPEAPAPEVQTALTLLGKLGCNGLDLSETDLVLAKLDGAFAGVTLSGCLLFGAHLSGDFQGADLRHALGRELSAPGVNFHMASLEEAYLEGANLRHAKFPHANLGRATLTGADLSGADLSLARGLDSANLRDATFDGDTKFPQGFQPTGMKQITAMTSG